MSDNWKGDVAKIPHNTLTQIEYYLAFVDAHGD